MEKDEPARLFFFSYSHADNDVYLERFFSDLRDWVAKLASAKVERVAFRDDQNIRTGEDWNKHISDKVQNSNVLLCIYSPSFFSKDKSHEFCAHEFAAFLKRQEAAIRYEPDGAEGPVQVSGARNILPVLWLSEADLTTPYLDLPPHVVRSIKYALEASEHDRAYRESGMRLITMRRGKTYWNIITHFARLIRDKSADAPPSITPAPNVKSLWNAFWEMPEPHVPGRWPPGAPTGGPVSRPEWLCGPRHVLAVELRTSNAPDWVPYPDDEKLLTLVEEIAHTRRLFHHGSTVDLRDGDAVTAAGATLMEATANQICPLLFVHPECMADDQACALLIALAEPDWRGGMLFPVAASEATALKAVRQFIAALPPQVTKRPGIVIRPPSTSPTELRTGVISVVDEVLAHIVDTGTVQRTPAASEGRSIIPRVTSVLDATQGE